MLKFNFGKALVIFICASVATACGGSSSSSNASSSGRLQVVNAITDSPSLRITLNEDETSERELDLNFRQASPLMELTRGDNSIRISYRDETSNTENTLIAEFDLAVVADTIHTLYLHGTYAAPSRMILERPLAAVGTTDSRITALQVVNLSTGTSVQTYFTDPTLDPANNAATVTLAAGTSSSIMELPAGANRVRLSREGATTIIYDSDEFQVPNNSRRTLVIHDNVGPDNNTLGSFQLTDAGLSPFQNAAARSSLFVVNAVADETNIVAGVTDTGTNTALVSQTLNFTDTIPFTNYDSGFLNVTANVASNPTNQVSTTISLEQDTYHTAVVGGSGLTANAVTIRGLTTNIRPTAMRTNINFVNTLRRTDVADNTDVDFYILPAGDALGSNTPQSEDVSYLEGSSTSISANEQFDLVVTTVNTTSILAGPTRITTTSRGSLLIMAAEGFGGSTPNQIVVINNG